MVVKLWRPAGGLSLPGVATCAQSHIPPKARLQATLLVLKTGALATSSVTGARHNYIAAGDGESATSSVVSVSFFLQLLGPAAQCGARMGDGITSGCGRD
jgi:hypothetical protein